MTDLKKLQSDAMDTAKKAINADAQNNYEEAYNFYLSAADKLNKLKLLDENNYSKESYKKKAFEYLQRAKDIQSSLPKKEEKKVTPTQNNIENKKENKTEEKKEDKKVSKEEKKDDKKDEEANKLMETLSGTLVTEKPNVKWSDVAGLDKAKEALQEAVILPIKFPHMFTGNRKPWKGILLYGPPGTGKSFLAKACATEAKGTFFSISASNIVSKWMGESERLVRALFDLARQKKPSVIFIDEIDSLMSARLV